MLPLSVDAAESPSHPPWAVGSVPVRRLAREHGGGVVRVGLKNNPLVFFSRVRLCFDVKGVASVFWFSSFSTLRFSQSVVTSIREDK